MHRHEGIVASLTFRFAYLACTIVTGSSGMLIKIYRFRKEQKASLWPILLCQFSFCETLVELMGCLFACLYVVHHNITCF